MAPAAAVALAALLDSLFAEPPEGVHPVVLLGRAIDLLDRPWSAPRSVGVAIALLVPLVAASTAGVVVLGSARIADAVGAGTGGALAVATLATGTILFSTISLRLLLATVTEVVHLSVTDPDRARRRLRALVGRDSEQLSPPQVRSAAIESAAENLSDGLVAPLFGFVVGVVIAQSFGVVIAQLIVLPGVGLFSVSPAVTVLAVGAGGTMWVKAVNTLDSMLGYRDRPIGWASARHDDLLMWLPARLCAVILALAATDPGALSRARGPARIPASPNAGWPMATVAAVLRVRLAKPGHYALACGPALPTLDDAESGIRVVRRAGWLAITLAGVSVALVGVSAVLVGVSVALVDWDVVAFGLQTSTGGPP